MAMIIIAKHRNGAVGDVLLRFKGKYTRFEDADENASYPLPGESAAGGFPQIGGGPITDADIPLPPRMLGWEVLSHRAREVSCPSKRIRTDKWKNGGLLFDFVKNKPPFNELCSTSFA